MKSWFAVIVFWICLVIAYSLPAGAEEHEPVSRKHIRSGAEIDYPPFSIVDQNGKAGGFSVQLMRAAVEAMGRKVTFRTGPWAEVRGWLERGEIDALPLVGRTPERETLFDFTVPYMTLHGAVVVRDDETGIKDFDDLRSRRVAVMKGDNAEEFLRRKDRGMDIHTTSTFEVALQELSEGKCDAVVIQRLVALRLIQKTGLTDLRVLDQPINEFSQDFCFAVREGDKDTLALLNEGLAIVLADGTYRHLHSRWFAAMQLPSDRSILVGGDRNFPPYEFLDENGDPAGFNVDLTRAIAREMGLNIEIRLGRWAERVRALENGDIDVMQGMYYSTARDMKFDFTPSHTVSNYVAVVRKGQGPAPGSVEELSGKDIIVQKGDIAHGFASEHGLEKQLTAVADQEEALRDLSAGKHDCALVSLMVAMYHIDKHGWSNLVPGEKPLLTSEYCFAASKGQKALLAQFSEGLKALENSGEYRRIYDKWLGVYKDEPASLIDALRYSAIVVIPLVLIVLLAFTWSWSLRRQVAEKTKALQDSLDRFRTFAELAPVGIVISDEQKKTLYTNSKFTELFGYTTKDMPSVDHWWALAYPEVTYRNQVRQEWREAVKKARETRSEISPVEYPVTCKDGSVRQVEFRMATTGTMNVVVFSDVTARKEIEAEHERLQSQLQQAQRMESIGRLAGGVAHDFNNMLGVIMGYTEFALEKTVSDAPLYDDLQEILSAAKRSSDITRQLLAFARQQTIKPKVLDLNETVEGMLKMLRRLISEDIHLSWQPEPKLWPVKIDPSQLDQILANLCVNARDAISDVGKVTIETDNVRFEKAYCADHHGFVPGEYVLLAVSDDGKGMDQETLDKIFEPFFTTKDLGKGTGLGLAMIYGIVKQNKGFINVYSEPGQGTTFRIYLPRHVQESRQVHDNAVAKEAPAANGETVLLVEDDASILKLAKTMLKRLGYTVMHASTPKAAMDLAQEHSGEIDLLITDVVMPEMNGRDLAQNLQIDYPELRVLFMSGYTANVIAHHGVLDAGVHFIQKPFSYRDLAVKVREALFDHG